MKVYFAVLYLGAQWSRSLRNLRDVWNLRAGTYRSVQSLLITVRVVQHLGVTNTIVGVGLGNHSKTTINDRCVRELKDRELKDRVDGFDSLVRSH